MQIIWLVTWSRFAESGLCPFAFSFRGTGSSDADSDIVSWTLDFGDGTSASGSWDIAQPSDLAHEYSRDASGAFCGGVCVITLTVTDSAGQSHSDVMKMAFVDQTPD